MEVVDVVSGEKEPSDKVCDTAAAPAGFKSDVCFPVSVVRQVLNQFAND